MIGSALYLLLGRSRWARALIAGSLATIVLVPARALGQPSATDRAAAEALYDQALTLMQSQQFAEACPKLEESQRLDPGVGTLLYLGHCYQEQGRLASAWGTFKEAAYAAADAGQSDREAMALERAESLKPRLACLTVTVAGSDTEGLEVLRDGEVQRQATWGVPVPIDPGEHTVQARAPDRHPWSKTIVVAQGPGTSEVQVPQLQESVAEPAALPPVHSPARSAPGPAVSPVPAQRPPAATSTPVQADSAPDSSQRTWGWIAAGAGGAAVAIGGVFAILAARADAKADEQCRPDDPTLCNEKGVSLGEDATRKAGVATLATGVGAALAIAGGVLVLTAPSAPAPPSVGLRLGAELAPTGATLGVTGLW